MGGCGCRRNKTTNASLTAAVDAASRMLYEVYTGSGAPTGRKFTSIISAQSYAARINGEVRTVER